MNNINSLRLWIHKVAINEVLMLMLSPWLIPDIYENTQKKLVNKTCDYLKINMQNKLTLKGVADKMGTNRNKLAESFKDELGIGVFEYLREERLEKAKYLLCNTNTRVQCIALEVGYAGCAHFSTAYRKKFGVSPAKDRAACMRVYNEHN